MRIRTLIIGAALAVVVVANVAYTGYFLDKERREARARLQLTIDETGRLLGTVLAGPLYDGNVDQLQGDLDSFFLNPDMIRLELTEYRGDIVLTRERPQPNALGELIDNRIKVVRGLDELGEIRVTYTTAGIEQRLDQSRNELILLSLVSVLGLAAVIFLAAKRLTRPIVRLTEAAQAMAAGQLDQTIDAGGARELTVLGESFVSMRDAIRMQMADLAEKNERLAAEVAQRREAEQERDRLISILEATTDLVSIADPQGNVLYLNQAGRRLLGVGDRNVAEFRIPEFHPGWATEIIMQQGIPAAIRDGAWSGDTALRSPDRSEIPVSQVILSHRDHAGDLQYLSSIMRDISERKHAEAELQRFKTTLDLTHDCVFMFDPVNLKFFYFNQGAMEQVGYRPEELTHMTPVDIKPDYDEPQFRALIAPLLAGERASISFETRHRHRDGHDTLVEIFLQYVAPANEPPRFVAIVRDITERKRAEEALRQSDERLRQAVRVSEIGIFDHDQIRDTIYWSPEQRAIYGWGPDEQVTLLAYIECVYPQDRELIGQAVRRAHDPAGDGQFDVEHRIVRRDGEIRWLSTRAQTFFAADGGALRPVRTIGAVLDVTDRKRAEEQIRTLNATLEQRVRERTAELEAALKELEAFSYSVSHDLRAPLRAIDGFSRILAEDLGDRLDADTRGYLDRVRSAVQRMGILIDDLLQLSRVGRAEMRRTDVDLSQLALEVVEQLRAGDPGRTVAVTVAPALTGRGDERLLRLVLENLLGNAWKYTRRTAGARIEFDASDRNGETVYRVRDNGAGFDMAHAHKLFGPFQRLHRSDEFEGTGIGLAVVARVVARHGGRVWAESEVGKGAAFFFTLA